jgi:L-alanine-DL-glutamate epimerase-like enolase superfamily enzyme
MVIESIVTERLLVPLRKEWIIACGRFTHETSPFLLIRMRANGVEGIGEVSGTYEWSGEGFETAEAAVKNVLAPALKGGELAPNSVRILMNKVLAGFPFTKAAIEMACWDALGKLLRVPVHTLLGGRVRDSVHSKFSISGVAPEMAADIAKAAWNAGFRKFKVKVGRGLAADLARVSAVRRSLGDEVSLGVDANGGWTLGEARRALGPLEELRICAIEQPLPPAHWSELAALRAHSRIPILLDESAWNAAEVATVARQAAADAVNVYVGKSGGILGALEAVQVAQSLGIGATMGSNLELGIGHAAILQVLALSDGFDLETYPPDVAGPMYYVADLVDPGFRIEDGKVSIPTGPGLGVEIDETALSEFRVT